MTPRETIGSSSKPPSLNDGGSRFVYRGLHAQRQAIEAGVKVAGCTVHFVGTGLDDGPIITQTAVPVYDNDTEETLSARILTREHPTYVRAVAAFCADKLTISGNHVSGMHSEEE